jgi:hypothetical protein
MIPIDSRTNGTCALVQYPRLAMNLARQNSRPCLATISCLVKTTLDYYLPVKTNAGRYKTKW